jgi:hypothetical protein
MIEATIKVEGNYVVYDPQNHIRFSDTGSTASHLAIILNKNEAMLLTGSSSDEPLLNMGKSILTSEAADVVVIKNGSFGAVVIDSTGEHFIPIFETTTIWPIGSGDIFTAAFAWNWAIQKRDPTKAALLASNYTADYCNSRVLPLSRIPDQFPAISTKMGSNKIYLAGPFFTTGERWLIQELRECLTQFGNEVFSPYHEIGIGQSKEIAVNDLIALENSDIVLAVINGIDCGTLFEVGYARAKGKKVVILAENVNQNDLTMLIGTDCIITNDLSTAVYKASW